MKRFLIFILALFILLPGLSKAGQITDVNLQTCIATAAGRSFGSLSDRDLLEITELECAEKDIASIAGIAKLANLVELNLNDNRIADISPLAGLDRLTILYLWHNRIADISPLAGLKQLKELYLESNEIENISPLAKLNMLEELLLGDNRIINIGPLAGLTRLDYLEIYNNQIADVTPLKGLTRLEYLDASGNSISDASALSKLGGLTRLNLTGNSLTDIKPLAGLKSVRRLFLGYNRIRDISALANLAELKILYLSANSIDNIAPLRNLINLKRLTLDNNLVSDISTLEDLPNLAHVSLFNNCINNIRFFAQPGIIAGMEYQHDLCSSPNLVRKIIDQSWLNEQVGRQCIAYGEKDYSVRNEYVYFSDGIYYLYFPRNELGEFKKNIVCRLPWDSTFEDFLLPVEKTEKTGKNFEIYRYGNNDRIFVQDGRIKGHSQIWHGSLKYKTGIEEIMEIFPVTYDIDKNINNGRETLLARKEDYVIQEIIGDGTHTLQFFESGFYAAEISGK
jgi:Leucine-rich repeat (LRR) protein